jgi:hypothetical protein
MDRARVLQIMTLVVGISVTVGIVAVVLPV